MDEGIWLVPDEDTRALFRRLHDLFDGMRVGRPDARASSPGRETRRRAIEKDGEETMGSLSTEDRSKASESLRALAGGEQVPTWPTLAEAVMGTRQCMRRDVVGRLADLAAVTVTEEDHERQQEIIRDLQRERDEALRDVRGQHRTTITIMRVLAVVTDMEHASCRDDSPAAKWAARIRDAISCPAEVEEDARAAKWVREHGGIEELEKMESLALKGEAESQAVKTLRELAEVGHEEAASISSMRESIQHRLMPPGYEWPRFDDGGMVEIGGHAEEHGDAIEITHVTVSRLGFVLQGVVQGDEDCQARYLYRPGERVKRQKPAPVCGDGLPVKVGETVRGTGRSQHEFVVLDAHDINPEVGSRFCVKCFDINDSEVCWCDPALLTHDQPELSDSWELVERDAISFAEDNSGIPHSQEQMERDVLSLVRRAKKLAGRPREEDE